MFHQLKRNLFYKMAVWAMVLTFGTSLICQPAYAQTVLNLPVPGTMVLLSPSFTPAMMKGMTIYPNDPFKFDFIIDRGDSALEGDDFKDESAKLIKYFLASLTTPEEKMWVNLSPYEKDRIIADGFDATEMGRDLLAQDYILKQLTASLLYPENELGKSFWNKVYAEAQEKLGTNDIPMDTFNKVWIIPERAVVYVHGKSAFVVESHLKVMLEEEYLGKKIEDGRGKIEDSINPSSPINLPSSLIKEIIIPAIEKEINEGKNFAQLRQIYNSLILATWYKKNLKKSLFGQMYVDKNKTKGVDVEDKQIKQKIYDQYLAAFKKGAYDYIKEDYDPATQEVISKKYFSGGVDAAMMGKILNVSDQSRGDLASLAKTQPEVVTTRIKTTRGDAEILGDSLRLSRIARQGRVLAAIGTVVGLGWYIGQPIVNWWNQPAWARKFQEEQLRRGGNVSHPEFPTPDIIGKVKLPAAGQGIAGFESGKVIHLPILRADRFQQRVSEIVDVKIKWSMMLNTSAGWVPVIFSGKGGHLVGGVIALTTRDGNQPIIVLFEDTIDEFLNDVIMPILTSGKIPQDRQDFVKTLHPEDKEAYLRIVKNFYVPFIKQQFSGFKNKDEIKNTLMLSFIRHEGRHGVGQLSLNNWTWQESVTYLESARDTPYFTLADILTNYDEHMDRFKGIPRRVGEVSKKPFKAEKLNGRIDWPQYEIWLREIGLLVKEGEPLPSKEFLQDLALKVSAKFRENDIEIVSDIDQPATDKVGKKDSDRGAVKPDAVVAYSTRTGEVYDVFSTSSTPGGAKVDRAMKSDSSKDKREGFGFSRGHLSTKQLEYAAKLRLNQVLQKEFVLLSDINIEKIVNALVRIKDKSLAMRPELFNAEDIKAILNYEEFDVLVFTQRLLAERNKYEAKKDNKGERLFSDKQIEELLYLRLISLKMVEELMDDGLDKTNAITLMSLSNPKQAWVDKKLVRDELVETGVNKSSATFAVLRWANAKEEWADRKLIRDELVEAGLNKSNATRVVLIWKNSKKKWADKKLIRDELVEAGLNKNDATYAVLRFANPKKEWADRKLIRDELVETGLNKSNATLVVLRWTNAKEEWTNRKLIRDELVETGLNKSNATLVVLRWTNAKEEWTNRKLIRDELVEAGLNKSNATLVVLRWTNAKEEWTNRKLIRDELVEADLNKSSATILVLRSTNAKEEWANKKLIRDELVEAGVNKNLATQAVLGWAKPKEKIAAIDMAFFNLRGVLPEYTEVSLRQWLIKNSYERIMQELKQTYGKNDDEINALLRPLEEYEKNFGQQKNEIFGQPLERLIVNDLSSTVQTDSTTLGETPGGIDLNPNKMDLQTTGEDSPLYAPVDPAMLKSMSNIDGAYPVIINVTPILNLPLLLGIKELPKEEILSYAK